MLSRPSRPTGPPCWRSAAALTAAQWQAASGCIDWGVQDLVTRDAEALAVAGTLRVFWL